MWTTLGRLQITANRPLGYKSPGVFQQVGRILVATMAEKSLRELDISTLVANRSFFPSPVHWEDEVVYFLMLDRFSNGQETAFLDNNRNPVSTGTTLPFRPSDNGNGVQTPSDVAGWRDA